MDTVTFIPVQSISTKDIYTVFGQNPTNVSFEELDRYLQAAFATSEPKEINGNQILWSKREIQDLAETLNPDENQSSVSTPTKRCATPGKVFSVLSPSTRNYQFEDSEESSLSYLKRRFFYKTFNSTVFSDAAKEKVIEPVFGNIPKTPPSLKKTLTAIITIISGIFLGVITLAKYNPTGVNPLHPALKLLPKLFLGTGTVFLVSAIALYLIIRSNQSLHHTQMKDWAAKATQKKEWFLFYFALNLLKRLKTKAYTTNLNEIKSDLLKNITTLKQNDQDITFEIYHNWMNQTVPFSLTKITNQEQLKRLRILNILLRTPQLLSCIAAFKTLKEVSDKTKSSNIKDFLSWNKDVSISPKDAYAALTDPFTGLSEIDKQELQPCLSPLSNGSAEAPDFSPLPQTVSRELEKVQR